MVHPILIIVLYGEGVKNMKLNKKIIIPAFTLLVGTALAGSVSSTVAWYQYSTKANVAYLGTSAGTIGNLKVRIKKANQADNAGWGTFISYQDVNAYFNELSIEHKLAPITSGAMGKDQKITQFYSNPVAGNGPLEKWTVAPTTSYVQIPLQFKFVEMDGELDSSSQMVETLKEKDLYVSDLLIQEDYANEKRDMSSAIRVHFDGYLDGAEESAHRHRLASKLGGNTLTVGQLDLDGDGNPDKEYSEAEKGAMYGFGGDSSTLAAMGTPINYGEVANQTDNNQVAYSVSSIVNQKLGTTSQNEGEYLNVLVTIWVEGWQQLTNSNSQESSIWDFLPTINSKFDVGMQFEAKDIQ